MNSNFPRTSKQNRYFSLSTLLDRSFHYNFPQGFFLNPFFCIWQKDCSSLPNSNHFISPWLVISNLASPPYQNLTCFLVIDPTPSSTMLLFSSNFFPCWFLFGWNHIASSFFSQFHMKLRILATRIQISLVSSSPQLDPVCLCICVTFIFAQIADIQGLSIKVDCFWCSLLVPS